MIFCNSEKKHGVDQFSPLAFICCRSSHLLNGERFSGLVIYQEHGVGSRRVPHKDTKDEVCFNRFFTDQAPDWRFVGRCQGLSTETYCLQLAQSLIEGYLKNGARLKEGRLFVSKCL